jgi:hypothetical protein
MTKVTSSDGTTIAFDRLGEGSPVIPADSLGSDKEVTMRGGYKPNECNRS